MHLVLKYETPTHLGYEFCSLSEREKDACVYPDVGCIHQGYDIPKMEAPAKAASGPQAAPKAVTEPEARAAAEAQATVFLAQEAGRMAPVWAAADMRVERDARAKAKEWAVIERARRDALAALTPAPPPPPPPPPPPGPVIATVTVTGPVE